MNRHQAGIGVLGYWSTAGRGIFPDFFLADRFFAPYTTK
jgi:hypothetical protein